MSRTTSPLLWLWHSTAAYNQASQVKKYCIKNNIVRHVKYANWETEENCLNTGAHDTVPNALFKLKKTHSTVVHVHGPI